MATPLITPGQIQPNTPIAATYKGERMHFWVDEVLHSGTDNEEVIVNALENKYFITSMAIDGSSWAKNVELLTA